MNRLRKIIHIDLDCYYAAIEMRDNPELRGKPVAVGGTSERSVVSTANYEARRFGVHSAMSVKRALELCPQLILVPVRHEYYLEVSEQIRQIFHEYTDVIEPLSCDEAFLDVTHNKPGMDLAVDIAREIKQKIHDRLQLTASAGVSYNKFLAKIASDYRKPDGLCVIHPERAQAFIDNLKIEQFWGIGHVTASKMHNYGIHTGRQLREYSLDFLKRNFGKNGQIFYDFARGNDDREVITDYVRKSLGCEHTFEKDIHTRSAVIIELYHVAEELVNRLAEKDFRGHTLTLKIKFHNFKQITRSISTERSLLSLHSILPLAKKLINEMDYRNHPIRLIGLSVSRNSNEQKQQPLNRQLSIPFKD